MIPLSCEVISELHSFQFSGHKRENYNINREIKLKFAIFDSQLYMVYGFQRRFIDLLKLQQKYENVNKARKIVLMTTAVIRFTYEIAKEVGII